MKKKTKVQWTGILGGHGVPEKKTIEGWAVLAISDPVIQRNTFNSALAVFPTLKSAMVNFGTIVPCTISYSLPSPKKRK